MQRWSRVGIILYKTPSTRHMSAREAYRVYNVFSLRFRSVPLVTALFQKNLFLFLFSKLLDPMQKVDLLKGTSFF